MEEVLARHRKEQRELQGRITQKKKNATKKTRKGVNDECDSLERELKDRQQQELAALEGDDVASRIESMTLGNEDQGEMHINGAVSDVESDHIESSGNHGIQQSKPKKPNRQKARLARRAAEQEAQALAAEEEAANLPDRREQELTSMKEQMEKRGLVETQIRPDGHCLYSAFAHGINTAEFRSTNSPKSYQNVRAAAATFMLEHPDDFAAFLEEPLEGYAKRVKDTAEWGGQLELQAMSRSFDVQIHVLQADGRVEDFEPGKPASEDNHIWLAYYRHSFGLGEHYNALQKT